MKYQHLQTIIKKVVTVPHYFYIFERYMKKVATLLLTISIAFLAQAQPDTVRILVQDSLIKSTDLDSAVLLSNVNVFKDPRLNVLKSRPKLVARNGKVYNSRKEIKDEIIKKRKAKLGVTEVKSYKAINRGKKRVTGSIVTRKGYRVNIYSGSSRAAAINAKRNFMRKYRGTPSYMSYITPYFKIRVGNYASKKSAYRMLRKVQAAGFPKSFVVPDIVRIKNINVR
jgi:hypothetical protein